MAYNNSKNSLSIGLVTHWARFEFGLRARILLYDHITGAIKEFPRNSIMPYWQLPRLG